MPPDFHEQPSREQKRKAEEPRPEGEARGEPRPLRRGQKNNAEEEHPEATDPKFQEVDDDPVGPAATTQTGAGAGASSSSGNGGLAGLIEKEERADVTEVYSPERVTLMAPTYGLEPGSSFDFTNGWDLSKPQERRRC